MMSSRLVFIIFWVSIFGNAGYFFIRDIDIDKDGDVVYGCDQHLRTWKESKVYPTKEAC